jgi:hypothetical protein
MQDHLHILGGIADNGMGYRQTILPEDMPLMVIAPKLILLNVGTEIGAIDSQEGNSYMTLLLGPLFNSRGLGTGHEPHCLHRLV